MALSTIYKSEVRRSKLFSSFEESQLNHLFKHGKLVHHEGGHHLFKKGDGTTCFYIVRRGCAKLFLTSKSGNEKTLDVVRPGMALAEIPMLTEDCSNHYCNCDILEDSELFEFSSSEYLKILQQNPAYSLPLMSTLGLKIQQQAAEIGNLTLADARHRLTRYIFSQIECCDKHLCDQVTHDCDSKESCKLHLHTSKATIASLLSIQRETFSRLLGKMKAEEVIRVHGSQIQITDLKKLRESAN